MSTRWSVVRALLWQNEPSTGGSAPGLMFIGLPLGDGAAQIRGIALMLRKFEVDVVLAQTEDMSTQWRQSAFATTIRSSGGLPRRISSNHDRHWHKIAVGARDSPHAAFAQFTDADTDPPDVDRHHARVVEQALVRNE